MYASGAVPVAARIIVVASIEVVDERSRSARVTYVAKGFERVKKILPSYPMSYPRSDPRRTPLMTHDGAILCMAMGERAARAMWKGTNAVEEEQPALQAKQ